MVVFKNRLAIGDYRSNVLFIVLQIEVFLLGKVSLATSVNHSDFLLFFLGLLPFIKILYSISINIHPTTTHCTFPIHPSHLTPPTNHASPHHPPPPPPPPPHNPRPNGTHVRLLHRKHRLHQTRPARQFEIAIHRDQRQRAVRRGRECAERDL